MVDIAVMRFISVELLVVVDKIWLEVFSYFLGKLLSTSLQGGCLC
jgi:hypothetical protein